MSMLNFNFLTFHAPSYIFCNIILYFWPIVLFPYYCYSSLITWISDIRDIMCFLQNHLPYVSNIRHINSISVHEYPFLFKLILIKFMWNLLLFQPLFHPLIKFIHNTSFNDLILQIWCASADSCYMHHMYLPTKWICYFIFLTFYAIDVKFIFT